MNVLPNDKYMVLMAELDPQLSPDDVAFPAAVVLLAACEVGGSQGEIMAATGYPRSVVAPLYHAYRKNRIFRSDGRILNVSDGMTFWVAVCCGAGFMARK